MHYTVGTRQVPVLRDVQLRIEAGSRVAIAGPSGSGKTSLLLLLAGLERPAGGRVEIDGVDLASLDRDQLADLRRDRIGIVFQSFHLLPSLSALDNVALPLQIAGRRDALPRARTLLERVGLSVYAEPKGGMFVWAAAPGSADSARLAGQASAAGIMLAPGHIFSPQMQASPWLRFNVAYALDPRLERFLGSTLGR